MTAKKVLAFLLFLLLLCFFVFFHSFHEVFLSVAEEELQTEEPIKTLHFYIKKINLKYSISIRGLQMQLTCQLGGGLKHRC